MGRVIVRRLCAFALSALSILALAACGGSSSTTSSSRSASVTRSTSSTSSGGSVTTSSTSPATTSSTSASGSAAGVSGCPTSKLRLSFVSGQGAAGTAYMTYALTNIGSATCTLFGYPGVSILDSSGNIVQHPAARGGIQAPTKVQLVTLSAGRQARFILTSSDVIPSPGCPHAYTGTTLQVFPPGQRAALTVARSGSFCNLRVGPVEAVR